MHFKDCFFFVVSLLPHEILIVLGKKQKSRLEKTAAALDNLR